MLFISSGAVWLRWKLIDRLHTERNEGSTQLGTAWSISVSALATCMTAATVCTEHTCAFYQPNTRSDSMMYTVGVSVACIYCSRSCVDRVRESHPRIHSRTYKWTTSRSVRACACMCVHVRACVCVCVCVCVHAALHCI